MAHAAETLRDDVETELLFDEDGFFAHPDRWTDETALAIARQDGIGPLNEDHWRVIHFVRRKHLESGALPPLRQICRSNQLSRQQVKKLFGSCREMWRVSGLPNPGEEAKAYMV